MINNDDKNNLKNEKRNDSGFEALLKEEGEKINNAKYKLEPASQGFKDKLKSQILEKREQKRSMKTNFIDDLARALKPKRVAPLVAFLMILFIITSMVPFSPEIQKVSPFKGFSKLMINPAHAEDNFELIPSDEDSLGVETSSIYVLKSKEALDTDLIRESLVIEPEFEYDLKKISETEWQIIPHKAINPNTIVSIGLAASYITESGEQKERDYSWAFQIKDSFKVINSIPRDAGVNVPVNSGIEITFSHDNFINYERFFEIEPKVEGRFEKHARTLVFIPNDPFEKGGIYTVTVKKGLPLSDSDETLYEDYSFKFETQTQNNRQYYGNTKWFYVYNRFMEIGTNDAPMIQVSSNNFTNEEIDLVLYKYPSPESYLNTLKERDNIPWWAYSKDNFTEDVSQLNKITEFKAPIKESDRIKYLEFPDKLEKGFYLVELSYGDNKDHVWIQCSDLSAYINVTKTNTIVWVNDVTTESPASDVKVDIVGPDVSIKNINTDNQGIAKFYTPYNLKENNENTDVNERYYLELTKDDNTLFLPISKISRNYWYWTDYSDTDDYWSYLYTDRPRYQTTDKIQYWGMLKPRDGSEIDEDITVSLYKQGYVDYYYRPVKIYEKDIKPNNYDTFLGEIEIKDLKPDYYTLEVKAGDTTIHTKYIEVKGYVKPAYNIELIPSKNVEFAGNRIDLVAKASFFEGTPVPNLDLVLKTPNGEEDVTTDDKGEVNFSYTHEYQDCGRCWPEYDYISVRPKSSELAEITASTYLRFYGPKVYLDTEVEYPEKGMAEISFDSKYIDLEKISNDYYWWYSGLGDEVAPNIKISASITKHTYEKKETGTRYDFINKRTYKTYDYIQKQEKVDSFVINTDNNGNYTHRFNVEPETSYSVDFTVYDQDGRFENYSRYIYYYDGQTKRRYSPYMYNYYHFEINDEDNKKFKVGDKVEARFMNNNEAMPAGQNRFLYLQLQNGLQEYKVGDNFMYDFTFEEKDIPNVNLSGVYFNGHSYITTQTSYWSRSVSFDTTERALKIDVSTDKEQYKPGEEVELSVNVTDLNDSPKQTEVNLNLIDEAYYAIIDDKADPISNIYSTVRSGSLVTESTHEALSDKMSGAEFGGCFAAGTKILMADGSEKNIEDIRAGDKVKTFSDPISLELAEGSVSEVFDHVIGEYLVINDNLKVTPEHIVYANGRFTEAGQVVIGNWMLGSNGDKILVESIEIKKEVIPVYNFTVEPQHTYIANGYYVHNEKGGGPREVFVDAALFKSIQTDKNGNGKIVFTLPDNITSWRVTAQAISQDLFVGVNTVKIPVSLPVFAEVTIGDEYLVDDKPVARFRAFGTALNKNDDVSFQVKAPSMGIEESNSMKAKAFETVYYEMPDLRYGKNSVVYELETAKGNDAIKLPLDVIESRLEAQFANTEKLTPDTKIEAVNEQPVTVVLGDYGQNMLYDPLLRLSWQWGDRVDQILVRKESRQLLETYYDYEIIQPDFEANNYQVYNGGITLLPYSSEDLELSARVAAIGAPDFDKEALAQYLFKILENRNSNREEISLSLFGLASLEKPVLPRLQQWLEREDLSAKERIYLAQALFDLGDKETSRKMYYDLINEFAEEKDPHIAMRVSENMDEVFQATALMAVLATSQNREEAWGFWDYLLENQVLWGRNKNSENLFNLEKLNFMAHTLPNLKPSPAVIKYELYGKINEVELTGGRNYSIMLYPSEVDKINFLEVQGEVGVSTIYVRPIDINELSQDADIKISRKYFVDGKETNTFKEDDIIEVRLYPSFGSGALSGQYQITDLLPSGLMPITNIYAHGRSYDCQYWYPYNTDGQKIKYSINRDWRNSYCGGDYIKYFARVKNRGIYKAEPAIMQSFINPDYVNYSSEEMVTITE